MVETATVAKVEALSTEGAVDGSVLGFLVHRSTSIGFIRRNSTKELRAVGGWDDQSAEVLLG